MTGPASTSRFLIPGIATSSVTVMARLREPAPRDLTLRVAFTNAAGAPAVTQRIPRGADSVRFDVPLPPEALDGQPHALGIMMRSFVEACRRGALDGDVDASFHDGLAAQQGLAAVQRSQSGPEWISLRNAGVG